MTANSEEVLSAIEDALENMNGEYWKLSKLKYSDFNDRLSDSNIETLEEMKYLERPLAYEFYHQLRSLIESGEIDFGGPIVQAEVDKRYQHYFEKGKKPDFIIHVPSKKGGDVDLAVIEFKRVSQGLGKVKNDLKKLLKFRKNDLNYQNLVEVLIGEELKLKECSEKLKELSLDEGEKIHILEFDVKSGKVINQEEIETSKKKAKFGKVKNLLNFLSKTSLC